MSRLLRATFGLAVLVAVSLAPVASASAQSRFTVRALQVQSSSTAPKSFTARIARSDRAVLEATSSKAVNVMVRLDFDPVASYFGGVSGLAPTSPEATGKALRDNRAAVDLYLRHVARVESRIVSDIKARIPQAQVLRSFRVAFGGVAVRLPANRAGDLLAVPGVVAVMEDRRLEPLTNVTPVFLGATQVWPALGGPIVAGEDVLVGVLDTGVWPEHPSYADLGLPTYTGGPHACEFGDGTDPDLGDPFTCNDKLVGAYAFTDTYTSFIPVEEGEFCADPGLPTGSPKECSARDANGHGTHTSGTAAGAIAEAEIFGVPRGTIAGMAPGARVIMYRVCLELGCFTSDSAAAVEQAILDGADVINFSISGGNDPYSDPVELAFLDFYAAGGLANASAGNSGPGAGTVNHRGPWTNTVGASTSPRHYFADLTVTADGGATFTAQGATITDGIPSPTDVVMAEDVPGYTGTSLCLEPFAPGSVSGMVVGCERGVIARVEKGFNVLQGGGAGFILYNLVETDVETDNHWLPAVHLDNVDGNDFLEFMEANTGEQATWTAGKASPVRPDVMASFSSRGPGGDFIKPDVTAPGIQILAGHSPEHIGIAGGPPGELFQAIAGTSMSSPHSAGIAALVRAAHPTWTPGQIKSALMTTALQRTVKEDGVTPTDPFDDGAGTIRANRSAKAMLLFNVSAADYFASAGDPLGRIDLNLPSINAPELPGMLITTRTVRNASGEDVHVVSRRNTSDGPGGVEILVRPSRFTVPAGGSYTFEVELRGERATPDQQYFGSIRLSPFDPDTGKKAGLDAFLPVAMFVTQNTAVRLTHECTPSTFAVGDHADCTATITNHAPVEAGARANLMPTNAAIVQVQNVSPNATPVGNNSWVWEGTLDPALAPTIDAIAPGGAGFGYVSLAALGVPPLSGAGDEVIFNFSTEPFLYGGETYSAIGMVSNGYAVVGGGDSGDVEFIPNDPFPSPARPNNVLAPFWTDLNPEFNGNMYAAGLGDSETGQTWVVFEWEDVATFSTPAEVQTFQLWVETTPGVERNSFEFGDIQGSGDPVGLIVGAENRDGTSAAQLGSVPADNSSHHVETSPPPPGGMAVITYDAVGTGPGKQEMIVRMVSDVQRGATFAASPVTVTPS